jgi:Undecaprenyl-phosphate glucose phosphotransferase
VLGTVDQSPTVVSRRQLNMVFIALPFEHYGAVEGLVKALSREIADVKIVPDVDHVCRLELPGADLDGLAMLSAQASPLVGWNGLTKRTLDILLSLLVLALVSPLLLLIALLVRLTSKGPVLYKQDRMGYDGHTFSIYKFRTMTDDAEGDEPTRWTRAHDPRRTRLGIFLRKTSLDELPQFFNVLMGDMSIVGPRPERPALIEDFRNEVPLYMLRHKIKAGITGWAQVNGWRGNTSLRKRIQYDLYYLRNWSIWFDIWIILLTPFRGLIHKNAY